MKNCLMILTILTGRVIHSMTPPWTQDVNQTYILLLEGVLDVFWTSYVRSIYVLCPGGGGGAETCYKNWGMKIEKWGTKRFPTDFSKFSEQLFSNFSVSFCFNSRLILKELWICILHIIHVRSLFCSINLHFLPVLFENPLFCFSVISVFSVCSSCHLFRRYNIFVIINYISAECSMIFFSFQKYSLFRPI